MTRRMTRPLTLTKALALVALATVGCGGGRSIMLSPPGDSTKTDARPGPDGSRDVIPQPALPDTGPGRPDVVREELRPLVPDVPPIPPDVGRPSDLVEVRPLLPDAGPDVLPPPSDTRPDLLPPFDLKPDLLPQPSDAAPDLLPPPLDLRPDLLPPPLDLRPDLLPARPDLASPEVRRPTPDGLPPLQICGNGEACFSDCQTPCSSFGTSTCTCTSGVLVCGACQPPSVHVTFTPCPDKASGTACDSSGLACPVYTSGSITGFCACLDLGSGMRWNCF
jgi:hypothetical protein